MEDYSSLFGGSLFDIIMIISGCTDRFVVGVFVKTGNAVLTLDCGCEEDHNTIGRLHSDNNYCDKL